METTCTLLLLAAALAVWPTANCLSGAGDLEDCSCYRFSGAGNHSGMFKSPQFPQGYPLSVPCLLFVFAASAGHIVRVRFDEFHLKPRIDGSCEDFVRLFLDERRAEISPNDRPNYELCGSWLQQREFYSSGPILLLQFHSEINRRSYRGRRLRIFPGFRGKFSFERAEKYRGDGAAVPGSRCDLQFDSSPLHKAGRLFSPRHPQNYRPNTHCLYTFSGLAGERVRLDIHSLDLGGGENEAKCESEDTADKDVVSVFDSDRGQGNLLAQFESFCSFRSKRQVVSSGNLLSLRFDSNGDTVTGRGFFATYGFVARHKLQPTVPIEHQLRPGLPNFDRKIFRTFVFDSRKASVGNFSSIHFPNVYPRRMEATYRFLGRPGERLQLRFSSFRLDDPGSSPCTQHYPGDVLEIWDGGSVLARCGRDAVAEFESRGENLTLVFRSDDRRSPLELGFSGRYRFYRPPLRSSDESSESSEPAPGEGDCPRRWQISSWRSGHGRFTFKGNRLGNCSWSFSGVFNDTERIVLEILELDIGSRETDVSVSMGCTSRSHVSVEKFHRTLSGAIASWPALRLCHVTGTRPVRVMSAAMPQLTLRLLAEKTNWHRGIAFAYRFVQDFGVRGRFRHQNMSRGCYFDFYSRHSAGGSFTSPNFPHAYPEQLTCTYVFHAKRGEVIRIEFTKFNTESASLACIPEESDYVTADECTQPQLRPLRRLCGSPAQGSKFSVVRRTTCLRVTFVSNKNYTAPGFHANYFFEQQSSTLVSQLADRAACRTMPGVWAHAATLLLASAMDSCCF